MNLGGIATTIAAAGGQIALAAFFGPQITAAAAGVVGAVEYLKRVLPRIPSTLTVLLLSAIVGASLASFRPAEIIPQTLPVLGAAWLGYAGIIARFRREAEAPSAGDDRQGPGGIQPKGSGGL